MVYVVENLTVHNPLLNKLHIFEWNKCTHKVHHFLHQFSVIGDGTVRMETCSIKELSQICYLI